MARTTYTTVDSFWKYELQNGNNGQARILFEGKLHRRFNEFNKDNAELAKKYFENMKKMNGYA